MQMIVTVKCHLTLAMPLWKFIHFVIEQLNDSMIGLFDRLRQCAIHGLMNFMINILGHKGNDWLKLQPKACTNCNILLSQWVKCNE